MGDRRPPNPRLKGGDGFVPDVLEINNGRTNLVTLLPGCTESYYFIPQIQSNGRPGLPGAEFNPSQPLPFQG